MASLELELSRERLLSSDTVERTFYRGSINLEIGGVKLPTGIIVNQHFGTDSIIEQNARTNPAHAAMALEILQSGQIQDYAFNPNYNQAFKLLQNQGPITGFSELVESQPLTSGEISRLEESLISDRAFTEMYGLKGRLLRFRGKRRKGFFPLDVALDTFDDGIFSVKSKTLVIGIEKGVEGVLEMEFNYAKQTFSASRHWLTGCVGVKTAASFINYWEGLSPEDKAVDFLDKLSEAAKGKVSSEVPPLIPAKTSE